MSVEQLSSEQLRKLDLGALAAENDKELYKYFVKTQAFERVDAGDRWMLLGNRGVGKTAIFKYLGEEQRMRGSRVIQLSPDDYSYEFASDVLAREMSGSWQKSGAFAAAWKWLILILVIRELADSAASARRKPSGKLHVFLRDRFKGVAEHPIDSLIGYLKRIEGIKLGQYEAGISTRQLNELFKLDELASAIPLIREELDRRSVYVLVDELDRGWDASEDAQYFVAGLFRAAIGLNQDFPNLSVLVSLRRELYQSIPALYDDAQKHRDVIETISWDEARLLAMVSERLRASFPKELGTLSDSDAWAAVFGDVLAYRNTRTFNYVIDRTLKRPRELISFCQTIREEAVRRQSAIDYAVVAAAERTYSSDRFDDIVSEYRFQFPNLNLVFERFRGRLYRIDRETLEEICVEMMLDEGLRTQAPWVANLGDASDLISALWEVGFLEARNIGGQKGSVRSGSQYVAAHHAPTMALDRVQTFRVHPMFQSHLGMKEK